MIYITGDTHGGIDVNKLTSKALKKANLNLTEEDYVIICGDFGFIWSPDTSSDYKYDLHWLEWFKEKPFTTLFVDGNHENFEMLEKYPISQWNGGQVQFINEKVIHLRRGQVFNIEGNSIFTFGGAESHDKQQRKAFLDWWPQELPTSRELDEGLDNLDNYNHKVDYIITHAAPNWFFKQCFPNLTPDNNVLSKYFKYLNQYIEFDHWYCGHLHMNKTINDCTCLYNQIVKLGEYFPQN